jgi:hypothetical protein
VIPLASDSKRPEGEWMQYQQKRATESDVMAWQSGNMGIVTGQISGVVVVDCESEENARWFMTYRSAGLLPGMARTPRGVHLYYRHTGSLVKNATHIRDDHGVSRYDIRGDGGYVVAPPSVVSGNRYQWMRPVSSVTDLPEFRSYWRPQQPAQVTSKPTAKRPGQHRNISPGERRVSNGANYIKHIQAISGQDGHKNTWRAVNRLRDSGLSEAEALQLMLEWNETNSQPAWSASEIEWKVKDCYSR